MMTMDQVQHAKAAIAMGVTGATIPAAWLSEIDSILRVILTLVGIGTGIYSMLYYRKRLKNGT